MLTGLKKKSLFAAAVGPWENVSSDFQRFSKVLSHFQSQGHGIQAELETDQITDLPDISLLFFVAAAAKH